MHSSFWSERKVLVTGATGFLGRFLVQRLTELRAEVIALVRNHASNGNSSPSQPVTLARGSLADFGFIRQSLSQFEIDTIFHLAAQPLVGVARSAPMATLETNVRGTWNVLEAARLCNVRQVLVASSDKAYGSCESVPHDESHPLQGRFPYDVSKSCADLISTAYAATYGTPICVLRCTNLFGGGDRNNERLVPGVIKSTLSGEQFVIRGDGTAVRDYLYVRDAVNAYLLTAQALSQDRSLVGEAFNFSSENPQTVLTVVEEVLTLMGRPDLRPLMLNERSAERGHFLCSKKARERLGWTTRYDLRSGLKETIQWYQSYAKQDETNSNQESQFESFSFTTAAGGGQ